MTIKDKAPTWRKSHRYAPSTQKTQPAADTQDVRRPSEYLHRDVIAEPRRGRHRHAADEASFAADVVGRSSIPLATTAAPASYDPSDDSAFQSEFRAALFDLAQDAGRFAVFIEDTFPGTDKSAAAQLRSDILEQRWDRVLPQVQLVEFSDPRISGAYAPSHQTMYLQASTDHTAVQDTYAEEVGHHLQYLLAGSASAALNDQMGDEGRIFANKIQRDATGAIVGIDETAEVSADLRTENDRGRIKVVGPDGALTTVDVEFHKKSFWHKVKKKASKGFKDLDKGMEKFADDLVKTAGDAVNTVEDAAQLTVDAVVDPSRLPADLDHLKHDGLDFLRDGWETLKEYTDYEGAVLDWFEANVGAPAVGWVDDKFLQPAAKFMQAYALDPANTAIAGAVSSLLGIPQDQVLSALESGEKSIGEFMTGFAEEGLTVVEGMIDMATKPGETAENMARLGYMLSTDPHGTWDVMTANYRDASAAERAGMIAADIASFLIPDGGEVSEAAKSAKAAKATGDVAKAMSESMEARSTALEQHISEAESALESLEEGTEAHAEAETLLAEAHGNLLDERSLQMETLNEAKDTLVGLRDNIDGELSRTDLSAADRSALEEARAKLDSDIDNVEALEHNRLYEHSEHLEELMPTEDGVPDITPDQRIEMAQIADIHGVKITPFEKDGVLKFAIESKYAGGPTSINAVLDAMREVMPEQEFTYGGGGRTGTVFDSDIDAILSEADNVLSTVSGDHPYGLRGGVTVDDGLLDDLMNTSLSEGELKSFFTDQMSPSERAFLLQEMEDTISFDADVVGANPRLRSYAHDLKPAKHLLEEVITEEDLLPRGGGVGAPGFTRENVVGAATASVQDAIDHVADTILTEPGAAIRQQIRDARSVFAAPEAMDEASANAANFLRRIEFEGAAAGEMHAIGLGNDVLAASYYGTGRHASSYAEIAQKMDAIAERVGHEVVTDTVQRYLGFEEGPLNLSTFTVEEAQVIREFTTIQIAERGRELAVIADAGLNIVEHDRNLVADALELVAEDNHSTFYSVYVTDAGEEGALFAQRGGQAALRDFYRNLMFTEPPLHPHAPPAAVATA